MWYQALKNLSKCFSLTLVSLMGRRRIAAIGQGPGGGIRSVLQDNIMESTQRHADEAGFKLTAIIHAAEQPSVSKYNNH